MTNNHEQVCAVFRISFVRIRRTLYMYGTGRKFCWWQVCTNFILPWDYICLRCNFTQSVKPLVEDDNACVPLPQSWHKKSLSSLIASVSM